ncbi:MAG: 5'/3'-nucleotidase SurE [Desulfurococcales archaeon]|nr:5'/3'-nucleotidase SurE [Desulfurococcales archaeon]
MRILVTNDDGIKAPGLEALVRGLSTSGYTVYLVAPESNQSGTGKAVKYPARIREVEYPGAARAWSIDSTPATAVLTGLQLLLDEKPDVVVSGINKGPNMGVEDLLTSGTVGAALEAAIHGIPSIAASLATDSTSRDPTLYRLASRLAASLAGILRGRDPVLLNLNVPEGKPRGIMLTRPACNSYRLSLSMENGMVRVAVSGWRSRYWDAEEGTDVWAVLNGYVSISVIQPGRLREEVKPQWLAESVRRGLLIV